MGEYLKNLLHNPIFIGLLVVILVDVITGKTKAVTHHVIDSSIGTLGILKHTIIILLNIVIGLTVQLLGVIEIGYIFGLFYILEYVTSILENLDMLGIPFPESFSRHFKRMREENKTKEL